LPRQPNLHENKPKWHKFQFCAKKRGICRSIVGYTDLLNSNMLAEFFNEPRELPWQRNLGKNKPKFTNFSSVQEIDELTAYIVRFSGSEKSNVMRKISRAPKKLLRQPNLDKNKPKLLKSPLFAKIEEFFACLVGFYGLGEFKFAI